MNPALAHEEPRHALSKVAGCYLIEMTVCTEIMIQYHSE
jgi:hypothetical protein